jgi:hypothetical protein
MKKRPECCVAKSIVIFIVDFWIDKEWLDGKLIGTGLLSSVFFPPHLWKVSGTNPDPLTEYIV